jgi:imidazolonepropionase-like amidohydrolase
MKNPASPLNRPTLSWLATILAVSLLLWLFLRLPGAGRRAAQGHRTVVSHVALYDPATGTLEADQDLAWQDGRITAIAGGGSLDASGALSVDGRGLCALPSLADAAVFLSLEGRYPANSVPAEAGQSLRLQGLSGMDGVLDLNANRAFMRKARALESAGLPEARFAGALFSAPGGWRIPGQAPWDSHVVELQEDADLAAPWNRALHFQDQAIFASVDDEGRDDLSIPLPVLAHLGALAHSRGLPFIIETHQADKALQALAAKPDALLGPLFNLEGAPGLAEALRAADCAYIPALSSVLNSFPPAPMDAWLRGFPGAKALDLTALAEAEDPQNAELWAAHWSREGADPAKMLAVVKTFSGAGVRLAFGTGSGLPLVYHGLGAQTEVAQLLRAGLSPQQILLSATLNSHALCGLEGGRLISGGPADVLLVAGDPRADPAAVVHPRRIFLNGIEVKP